MFSYEVINPGVSQSQTLERQMTFLGRVRGRSGPGQGNRLFYTQIHHHQQQTSSPDSNIPEARARDIFMDAPLVVRWNNHNDPDRLTYRYSAKTEPYKKIQAQML